MLCECSVVWIKRGSVFREHAELLSGVGETIGKRLVRTWEGSLEGFSSLLTSHIYLTGSGLRPFGRCLPTYSSQRMTSDLPTEPCLPLR